MAYKQHVMACISMNRVNGPRRETMRAAVLAGMLLTVYASLSGCATIQDWDAIHGKVLSAETSEPIEGVVLVYHWIGTWASYVASSDQCYHLEAAVTDADGDFVIPAWKESLGNRQHRNLGSKRVFMKVAYKPGYRVSNLTYEKEAWEQDVVYLQRDKPKSSENQLWDLLDVIRNTECGDVQNIRRALQSTYLQIFHQADQLAKTDKEREIVDEIKYTIVRILGYSGYPPTTEEIDKFFSDHAERLPQ